MLIATCFGCTLYYFYAFSGTNLLTRCQSASSVFPAVFGFRNIYIENIVKIGGNLFLRTYNIGKLPESEDHLGGGPRGPHPMGARPRVGPRRGRVWWPWLAPGPHPSPIYCPRRENPNTNRHLPRKVPSRPSSSISDRGSSDVLPAPCRRGNHHRGLLHHHACLRSDA